MKRMIREVQREDLQLEDFFLIVVKIPPLPLGVD